MATLQNIQGSSLVPNFAQAVRQDVTAFRDRNRAQEAQSTLAEQLRVALGGEPQQAAPQQAPSSALGLLGQLNPQIAQMIGQLTQSKDPKAVEDFRAENEKGIALSSELLALPDHGSRVRRLREEGGNVAAQGGDVNRIVDLANMSDGQLQLQLEKMQVIGKAALEAAPSIQTGGPTAFLSDPARREAFTKIAASNPALAQTLLSARDRELTRSQSARNTASQRNLQERQFAVGRSDAGATQQQRDVTNQLAQDKFEFDKRQQDVVNARENMKLVKKKKKTTVDERKNAGFLLRGRETEKILFNLEDEGTDFGQKLLGLLPLGTGNFFKTPKFRKYEQAQRNFINAVLRRESGAVISESEFDNARQQYFPQPGDDPGTIQQKRDNRLQAIQGFEIGAGREADNPLLTQSVAREGKTAGGLSFRIVE